MRSIVSCTIDGDGERQRRAVAAHDNGARAREQPDTWLVHILVGDGVPTNLAAAKLMWAAVVENPFPRVRYFIIVVKCATHQAALTAKAAVTGSFAAAAGGELYKAIAGAAVRLCKYLINDYYEEFCNTAGDWVSSKLRVVAHGTCAREKDQAANGLRDLYTKRVISDEMMFLWNCGFSKMLHEVGAAVDPNSERPALVARFARFIIQELLKVNVSLD